MTHHFVCHNDKIEVLGNFRYFFKLFSGEDLANRIMWSVNNDHFGLGPTRLSECAISDQPSENEERTR